jgi:hypothetical protein
MLKTVIIERYMFVGSPLLWRLDTRDEISRRRLSSLSVRGGPLLGAGSVWSR